MRVKTGREFLGRFKTNSDLLKELTEFCIKEKITLGTFQVIGAVKSAKMGYYHQKKQRYIDCVNLKKKLEITSCLGNVSIKDNEIFVHAHIALADLKGVCYGGHLMPGTIIFAAEYYIKELTGAKLIREFDQETGLNLWP
jgi:predicted DNA-binding protein with PD1-like motif